MSLSTSTRPRLWTLCLVSAREWLGVNVATLLDFCIHDLLWLMMINDCISALISDFSFSTKTVPQGIARLLRPAWPDDLSVYFNSTYALMPRDGRKALGSGQCGESKSQKSTVRLYLSLRRNSLESMNTSTFTLFAHPGRQAWLFSRQRRDRSGCLNVAAGKARHDTDAS